MPIICSGLCPAFDKQMIISAAVGSLLAAVWFSTNDVSEYMITLNLNSYSYLPLAWTPKNSYP